MTICSKCGAEMKEGAAQCPACGSGVPGPEARNIREKKRGRVAAIVVVALLAVLSAWGLYYVFSDKPAPAPLPLPWLPAPLGAPDSALPITVRNEAGEVRVPLESLEEGRVHFYSYPYSGKEIKFFLFRKPDGSVVAALDSCDSCYRAKRGFRSEDGFVVCNDCGMSIRLSDIGVITGGCNPLPLAVRTAGGMAALKTADLEAKAKYF